MHIEKRLFKWQIVLLKFRCGISQQDELAALNDAGIKSISLSTSDDTGRNVASVTMTDGSTVSMGEFDFDAQYYNTIEKNKPQISDEIAKQPDISAIGNVESLHTLMQNDKSGVLKGYIEQFAASGSRAEKETLATKILYFITGADKVESGSRGSEIDAQKLAVVEKFEGREFIGTEGSNPVNTASAILNSIYNDIYDVYYSYLNAQTQLKGYMDLLYINEKEDGSYVINTSLFDKFIAGLSENGIDLSEVVGEVGRYIKTVNSDNATNFTNYLATYISNEKYYDAIVDICYKNQIKGSTNADTLQGSALDEVLFGNDGNDVLYGNDGNDLLVGGDGQDTLYGGNGDDVLIGGVGDDYLSGDAGTDIYIHSRGDGNCVINNYDASESRTSDKLVLNGVKKSEVEISRNGYDMIIRDTVSKETVTVKNAYNTSYGNGIFYLENVEFDDGKFGKNDLLKATSVRRGSDVNDVIDGYGAVYNYSEDEIIYAGAGDDTVHGNNGDDVIYGESGNDTLYGGNGDDVIVGGIGEDYLAGDAGADIYIHSRGDGNDVINNYDASESRTSDKLVLKGVKKSDVEISRNGLNIIISDVVGNEVITIKDAYNTSYGNGIFYLENVEFDDGKIEKNDLLKATSVRRGSDANDVIDGYGAAYNYSEDETIYAGAGDDTVHGYNGNDTIYGGDGNDTLYGDNGDDVIIGGKGEDFMCGGAGADTYIHARGDGNDVINNYDTSDGRTSDKLILKGIEESEVEISRSGNDMVIRDIVGKETVTIKEAYNNSYGDNRYYLENIEYEDEECVKEKSADKQTAITEKSTSEQNKKKGDTLCKNTATVTSKEESSNCSTGIHVTTSGSTSDNNSLKVANETDKDKKIVKEIKDIESQSKTDVVKNEYTVSVSNESEITSTKEKEASVNNNHAVLDKKSSFNDAEPDVSITKTSDNKKEAGNTSLEKEVKTVDNIISNIEVVKVENEYTSIADTSQTLSASSDSITKMTELIIQDISTDVSGNVSDSSLLASTGAKESNVQLWTN